MSLSGQVFATCAYAVEPGVRSADDQPSTFPTLPKARNVAAAVAIETERYPIAAALRLEYHVLSDIIEQARSLLNCAVSRAEYERQRNEVVWFEHHPRSSWRSAATCYIIAQRTCSVSQSSPAGAARKQTFRPGQRHHHDCASPKTDGRECRDGAVKRHAQPSATTWKALCSEVHSASGRGGLCTWWLLISTATKTTFKGG